MGFGRIVSALVLIAVQPSAVTTSATPDGRDSDRIVALDGGRRIALRCGGRGNVTVLLETGDGGRRAHMAALFAALSKWYRVCDYDRRNIGQSSQAPLPRKAAELAADVFDALSAAGVHGPYILFGTSMGGLLVRSYAATHTVAGFVTSNQPGTAREWTRRAYPAMSPAERAADAAWMSGGNHEHVDVNDLSRTIDGGPPPSVPYVIMVSTERFQCKAAGVCGPAYRAYLAASREAAHAGAKGRLRIIDGDHDLYVSHLGAVVAAIEEVAARSARGSTVGDMPPPRSTP